MDCHFDEKEHKYYIDGVHVPSVTKIIKPLSNYDNIPADILQRAQDYGHAVHQTINLWLSDSLDEFNLDPHLTEVLWRFKDWYFSGQFENEIANKGIVCETPLYSKIYGFAGTPDIIIPDIAIIDIKTRAVNKTLDSLQLAGYNKLYSDKPMKLIVLHLEPCPLTGVNYKETEVGHKKAWPMFATMLERYYEDKNFNKKLEGWRNLWK